MTVLMTRRGEIPNIAKEVSASDLEIGSIVKLPFYTSDSDSDNDGYTEFIVVHQGNPNSSVYDPALRKRRIPLRGHLHRCHRRGFPEHLPCM